jgi:hypothetical protein
VSEDDTAGGVICFATRFNEPGRRDATGAFQPRARAFAQIHGGKLVLFDDSKPMHTRGAEILRHLSAYSGRTKLVCVAFFSHGWSRGIEAGFDLRPSVGMPVAILADALAEKAGAGLVLPLYCCSTGDSPHKTELHGDGSFADELRDELAVRGLVDVRIDAHDRDGHTTENPYVWRFDGNGQREAQAGGAWLVPPTLEVDGAKTTNPLFAVWNRALKDGSGFDLVYPWLGRAEIERQLRAR